MGEKAVEHQDAQQAAPDIDFAHLLALVKDFGDDLGGFEGVEPIESRHACEDSNVFAICSPRESEDSDGEGGNGTREHLCDGDEDVFRLKRELERTRMELNSVRAELASRDAELIILRKSLGKT